MGLKGLLIFAFFVAGTCGADTDAAPDHQLRVSSSLTVRWSTETKLSVGFLPSFRGFWLEGEAGNKSNSVWITTRRPTTLANSFSVKRLWRENLDATGKMGEQSTNLGCKALRAGAFRCDRTVRSKTGRFAAETLVWNAKSDLVAVRTMSSKSEAAAKTLLEKFDFDLVTRLPAGVRRR